MSRIVFVNKKETQLVTTWAGGTTTELCIYPFDSKYAQRDFICRISTAIINQEESVFTALPGFTRSLMMLNGAIELTHNNENPIPLSPFQVARFEGEWQTNSIGKGVDFNVMTNAKAVHSLSHLFIEKETIIDTSATEHLLEYIGFYSLSDDIFLTCDNEKIQLSNQEFILLELTQTNDIILSSKKPAHIIQVKFILK